MTGTMMVDVDVRNEGTVWLLTPLSNLGEDWLREHLAGDPPRIGKSYAVEHRYAAMVLTEMGRDGLVLR